MATNVVIDNSVTGVNSGTFSYSSGGAISTVDITHNLGGIPGITVKDSLGNDITLDVEYQYLDLNTVRIILTVPTTITVDIAL